MTDAPKPTAGWYPDPSGSPRQRYFDGSNWTDNYSDDAKWVTQPEKRKIPRWQIAAAAAGCIVVVLVMVSVAGPDRRPPTPTRITEAVPVNAGPKTMSPSECKAQAVPKCDGVFRVTDGGFLSTGLLTGWIRTEGPLTGRSSCYWSRLSGPDESINNTIATGRLIEGQSATVEIKPGDYAFSTHGCQPWQKVG
ncbi:Protein of uncharacterised function (DUF2510) [Mycobacteroides abscessus subsp. abscessus]|uniref:DUF2510 domain-containing protein n=1 Tax=Mycobacteroides abscessus TaxID=36809 RepID=UPI000928915B|nr:DUF2510 domain-containing protein [Mycobacteroides abscessus]SHW33092.1 Protein of uncharacterised function (DUF2510) [Mycobacteroides abscessus subsp. abscessus]SHW52737.1 Protein of uncharacterised function (DUF2510) [Mycobacteroides abscessus subsp. abscessus]SIC47301.1 Protein of uncharacterised function (DUF2510) [Mycobacteroides abscessus subsp. abscessus]SKV57248.1 Protein of uncharacterised function (DUF2510) [Mycobacteroides abscessus subsp. abscessus]